MYPYVTFLGEQISVYYLCAQVGLLLSYMLLNKLLSQKRIFEIYILPIAIALIGMIFCARLTGVLSDMLQCLFGHRNINLSEIWNESGIVYFGGLYGFIYCLKAVCKLKKVDFETISDIFGFVIPFFHVFGRIGCFFAGCCYGKTCDCIFAIPYRLSVESPFMSRIPIQLYEAFVEFVLSLIMYLLYKTGKHQILKKYVVSYSIWRFFAEIYRDDTVRGIYYGLSFSQIICIITLTAVLFLTVIRRLNRE